MYLGGWKAVLSAVPEGARLQKIRTQETRHLSLERRKPP